MAKTDKQTAAWLYYEEGETFYCLDCVQTRIDEVNTNKEFASEINYQVGEKCSFFSGVADVDCEMECCKCGTLLFSLASVGEFDNY